MSIYNYQIRRDVNPENEIVVLIYSRFVYIKFMLNVYTVGDRFLINYPIVNTKCPWPLLHALPLDHALGPVEMCEEQRTKD